MWVGFENSHRWPCVDIVWTHVGWCGQSIATCGLVLRMATGGHAWTFYGHMWAGVDRVYPHVGRFGE